MIFFILDSAHPSFSWAWLYKQTKRPPVGSHSQRRGRLIVQNGTALVHASSPSILCLMSMMYTPYRQVVSHSQHLVDGLVIVLHWYSSIQCRHARVRRPVYIVISEQYRCSVLFNGCSIVYSVPRQTERERERMQGLLTAPAAASPVTAAFLRRRTAGTQLVQHTLPRRGPCSQRHLGNFLSATVIN